MKADNDNGLRFLSVCSGIEAASVAWHPLGWQCVGVAEIEPYPAFVLNHHYGAGRPVHMPDPGENQLKKKDKAARLAAIRSVSKLPVEAPLTNWGDFTKIDTSSLGRVDILCGGTPCQAFSVAGLRGGLNDERGNLTLKFVELAHELAGYGKTDGNGLRNVVWENVVGVLSDKGNAFGCFLAGLVGADAPLNPPTRGKWGSAGLVSGPKGRAAWRICDAQFWGVAQRRRRVIVVADFGIGADPAEVLFELEGVQRHSPPSREAGKDVAGAAKGGSGGGGVGVDITNASVQGDIAGTLEAAQSKTNRGQGAITHAPEIARCVATREGSSQDYETTTMVAVGVTGDIAHTLKAEGADASEDGTGRGTPIVAFVQNSRDEVRLMGGDGQIVGALAAEPGAKQQCYVAQTVAIRGREGGATAELGGEVATALRASQGGGDKPHVLAQAYSIMPQNSGKDYKARPVEVAQPLMAGGPVGGNQGGDFILQSAVRRLTPVECERLQGFPDGYTAIPWRGKPADQCPDGPRYKSLGNSWAVPKFAWLGRRIAALMPALPATAANANDNKDTSLAAA